MFLDHHAAESLSARTRERLQRQRDLILRLLPRDVAEKALRVADVGGGAGTSALLWAEQRHEVHCLDIDASLLEIGRNRARKAGLDVEFHVGNATALPWPDASMDVCLAPELLEHVEEWRRCLDEISRILSPGGLLFLSTTNVLCPVQQEFELPLYSWYPRALKRRCERLARSTRPWLANYTAYPAINWFTIYELREALRRRGFDAVFDRFDLARLTRHGAIKDSILALICAVPPARALAWSFSTGTTLIARKASRAAG